MAAENPGAASGRPLSPHLSPHERTMMEIAEGQRMGELYARSNQFKEWLKKGLVKSIPQGWLVAGEVVEPIERGHIWMGGDYLPSESEFAQVGLALMALERDVYNP